MFKAFFLTAGRAIKSSWANLQTFECKGWCVFVGRSLKYTVLFFTLLISLYMATQVFSYYVARRGIDAELESKKTIPSLEYLTVLAEKRRALSVTYLETRCTERAEISLYRSLEGQLATELDEFYSKSVEAKGPL